MGALPSLGEDEPVRAVAHECEGVPRVIEFETLVVTRAEDLVASARQISGVAVIAGRIDGLDADGLRSVADTLRTRLGSGVVCVGSVLDGKVSLVAAVTKDLTSRFPAGKLIQEVAKAAGGGGGGRPDLAQAGGKDPARLDAALELAFAFVARGAGGRPRPLPGVR